MPFTRVALPDPNYLSDKTYQAQDDRSWWEDVLSEGVVGATDFAVTLASGFNVDIAGGSAYVLGGDVADQGMYRTFESDIHSLAVGANASGNPRIDQIVLRIRDASHDTSGTRGADLVVVPGNPTAGATLGNRLGAVDIEAGVEGSKSVLLLADLLINSGGGSISGMSDRRVRAAIGGGNASNASGFSIGTSISSLDPVSNGKTGMMRVGSDPHSFVVLVYDSTYGKWVSAEVPVWRTIGLIGGAAFSVAQGAGYADPGIDKKAGDIVRWSEFDLAGLTMQMRWEAGISSSANDGTIYGSAFYKAANENGAWSADVQVTGSEWVSGTPPGLTGGEQIRSGGWADVPGAAADFLIPTLKVKKVGGTGQAYLTQGSVWMRWVA